MTNKDYVVFEDSNGNEISNDPRWQAERVLKQQGGVDVDAQQAELEELRAFKAAHEVSEPPNALENAQDYSAITGDDLAKLAKERGIELTKDDGTKMKAGEVREALAAQDAANATK